jgi:hypothetical protein
MGEESGRPFRTRPQRAWHFTTILMGLSILVTILASGCPGPCSSQEGPGAGLLRLWGESHSTSGALSADLCELAPASVDVVDVSPLPPGLAGLAEPTRRRVHSDTDPVEATLADGADVLVCAPIVRGPYAGSMCHVVSDRDRESVSVLLTTGGGTTELSVSSDADVEAQFQLAHLEVFEPCLTAAAEISTDCGGPARRDVCVAIATVETGVPANACVQEQSADVRDALLCVASCAQDCPDPCGVVTALLEPSADAP